jgi:hypothetical protein
MKLKTYISLFLILISTSFVTAQVKFEAKVSKTKLGINERLRVDFEMNTDGDNFSPPSFTDFTVVGGPNQSVSHSWVNGVRSFSKTYSYFLAPKKNRICYHHSSNYLNLRRYLQNIPNNHSNYLSSKQTQ